jgi:hypothetical protein
MRCLCLAALWTVFFATTLRAENGSYELFPDLPAGFPRAKAVRQLTHGPKHHFVGYYGICPWNENNDLVFCLETDFADRAVEADDRATLCVVKAQSGEITRVRDLAAWNFQQGAMIHWLPPWNDRQLIYNDRVDGQLRTCITHLQLKQRITLERPIAALSPDARTIVSFNYDRLRWVRPVVGYAGGDDPHKNQLHPKDDGLFTIDISDLTQPGKPQLIFSLDDAFRLIDVPKELQDQPLYFNHVLFNKPATRLFLIARIRDPSGRGFRSAAITLNPDGSDPRVLAPWGKDAVSHYDWVYARKICLTTRWPGQSGLMHVLFTDEAFTESGPERQLLAPDVLRADGHCSFSVDEKWMVTDSYPDRDGKQNLYLLHLPTNRAARIARFDAPKQYRGDWRCDLHPRWRSDNREICIDSAHDGTRQVYVVELDFPQ